MVSVETGVDALSILAPVYPLKKPLGAILLDDAAGVGEFEEYCWQYLHTLPSTVHLGRIKTRLILEEEEAELRAEGPGGGSRLEFDSCLFIGNEPIGQLMVSLYRHPQGDPNEVYLELEQAQIWKRDLRGMGLGRAIFENVKALGRTLGAKSITLFAMHDGRFVWPSLGFEFGDYLPDPAHTVKYRRAFRNYCRRHQITPPNTRGWKAADFARFFAEKKMLATVGYRREDKHEEVELGRAFMLSRRPFFLCFPLD